MRYVIIGAGAVGQALAAEYDLAGIDYLLIGRGAQLDHLRAHGLTYVRPSGTRTVPLKVAADTDLTRDDILILTVKTQDVEGTTAHWADLPVAGGGVAADLPLVTLQNGLEAERIAARRFSKVYAASILVPAVFVDTGKVTVRSGPQLASVVVGRYPEGTDATVDRIVADLTAANSLAEARPDITRWKAAKLLHNVRNALELFSGDPTDAARHITDEARTVLEAAGLAPAERDERKVDISGWKVMRGADDEPTGQSTWQSFTRGARSEVDYLNGEIARLGMMHGVPTPWNRAVQRLAARLAASGGAPGDLDLNELTHAARAA
ncbi:ketopantoate reductase family protein [Falsirhodobacter halotolerans]|uniref:ketopantoate reductase family protein n=1 Tax=Falsirhodobacter halotolerans TaxID=1146892 RepID=UPI001FD52BB6|nr:2-dehydropantoate 2-reductase N-terminal domain-containing protein [Falsirhodobacter halotolerans]MCJ8138975.1 ketopantoate reductase family protein [Falsirhodobacter halotolerans]